MGVYIKGMEMPKKIEPGLVVEFAEGIDGKRYARLHHYRYGALTDWLEAVPVPPHGRLIDADALKKNAYPFPCAIGTEWAVTLRQINDAPTVIPADREDGET